MSIRQILCCTAFGLFLVPQSASALQGKLSKVEGEAWVRPRAGSETAALLGGDVAEGTQIRTGDRGRVEVQLDDGSTLKLEPGSQLMLSAHRRKRQDKSSVVLFFGRLWSKVTGGSDRRSYEVKTPNAVCGVRGTEFVTAVGDDGSVRVRVSEGAVGVDGESGVEEAAAGEEIEADENGVAGASAAAEQAKWRSWEKSKKARLRSHGRQIVDKVKGKIMSRKDKLSTLRDEQKKLLADRKPLESRAQGGDAAAVEEIKAINQQLVTIADAIADIGDQAESQFGIVDHFADLASDPKFGMVDRKYLEAEAASLRRVKKMFDAMVEEGTDISMEAMEKMLKDFGEGKTGSLKDRDSAADELFGKDDMDMDMDMR